MKTLAAALLVLACAACQGKDDAKPATAETVRAAAPGSYARDIDNLCNVVERSGAGSNGDDTPYTTAVWLGSNITTPEGKQFLVKVQPLVGEAKATALETEAKRVGLAGCPLAADWRKPAP